MQHELITDPTTLKSEDSVIILLGLTGAGKSNMIDRLLNSSDDYKRASDGQTSPPPKIEAVKIINNNYSRPIVAIDTPGFDHPDMEKFDDTLKMITAWLSKAKNINRESLRVLYFHRITDSPVQEEAFQILDKFLQSWSNARNLVFVTTMWDIDSPIADARALKNTEEELKTKYWKKQIKRKARVERFDQNNFSTAWKIINSVATLKESIQPISYHQEKQALHKKINGDHPGGHNMMQRFKNITVGRCGTQASTES